MTRYSMKAISEHSFKKDEKFLNFFHILFGGFIYFTYLCIVFDTIYNDININDTL